MLDPYWIGGPKRHVKRTRIKKVVLLRRDSIARDVERLDPEVAARHVEEGRDHLGQSTPFLNPHLLVRTMERNELQSRSFRKLFEIAPCDAVNLDRLGKDGARRAIRDLVFGG